MQLNLFVCKVCTVAHDDSMPRVHQATIWTRFHQIHFTWWLLKKISINACHQRWSSISSCVGSVHDDSMPRFHQATMDSVPLSETHSTWWLTKQSSCTTCAIPSQYLSWKKTITVSEVWGAAMPNARIAQQYVSLNVCGSLMTQKHARAYMYNDSAEAAIATTIHAHPLRYFLDNEKRENLIQQTLSMNQRLPD